MLNVSTTTNYGAYLKERLPQQQDADKWDKTETHDELNSWRKSFKASSVKIVHEEDMTWLQLVPVRCIDMVRIFDAAIPEQTKGTAL